MIARSLHNLAASKLVLINSARISYISALSSLPRELTESSQDCGPSYTDDDSSSGTSSSTSTPSPTTPTPKGRLRGKNLPSKPNLKAASSPPLWPSPLHIRKPLATLVNGCEQDTRRRSLGSSKRRNVTFTDSTAKWLRQRATERLNAHLVEFNAMLRYNIEKVIDLAKSTEEAQANRYNGRRLAALEDDEHVKFLDRQDRIRKLKARSWERERFNPKRYQTLCEKALAEL